MTTTATALTVLRQAIDEKGLRYTFLAERAGITQSHFTRLLNAERKPTKEFVDLMAQHLGIEPDAFFDGRELLLAQQTQEGVEADASGGAHLGTPPALGATA